MDFIKGIGFIIICHMIISFFNPNNNPRFALKSPVIGFAGFFGSIILFPLISLFFFPLWFALFCYGLFITFNLGVDPKAPVYTLSQFERKNGMMFNNIGMAFFVAAIAVIVYQYFI